MRRARCEIAGESRACAAFVVHLTCSCLRVRVRVWLRERARAGRQSERLRDEWVWVHGTTLVLRTDDAQVVVLAAEECGEVGRGDVGVVAADRVEHIDAVLDQLIGRDTLRVLSLLDEACVTMARAGAEVGTVGTVVHAQAVGCAEAAIAERSTVYVRGRHKGVGERCIGRLDAPRLTQSLTLVSLTRELPIGEPPCV